MVLRFALRNLGRQRLRTTFTVTAIAVGVAALIVSAGFVSDLLDRLGEATIHSQTGHLQVAARGYFAAGGGSPERYRLADAGTIRREILSIPGVHDVLARVAFSGLLDNGRGNWPVIGDGVEPDREARLGTYLHVIAGRNLDASDPYGIVIGEGVANALGLRPGDRVTLLANTDAGGLNSIDFGIRGIFRTYSRDYDAHAVRASRASVQELLGTKGISVLVVWLDRTSDTARVASLIGKRLAGRPVEVESWSELDEFYGKTVALYRQQFGILQAIVLVMVVLGVANSINMTMLERTGEFGTMRALGRRGRQVFGQVVLEGTLLGVIGGAVGIALGVAIAMVATRIGIPMPPPPNANAGYVAAIRLVPSAIASAFATGIAASIVASLLPARRLARMPIAVALRANL